MWCGLVFGGVALWCGVVLSRVGLCCVALGGGMYLFRCVALCCIFIMLWRCRVVLSCRVLCCVSVVCGVVCS